MKRSTKGLLLAGAAFFAVGAALGIASVSAGFRYGDFVEAVEEGRFNFAGPEELTGKVQTELFGSAEQETRFEETYTGVKSLKLKAGQADCEIILCGGPEWKVKGEHLLSRFRCDLDDDELCIDCSGALLGGILRLQGGKTAKLEVYVPRDQILDEVDIEAGVGTVRIAGAEDFLRCRSLDLECGVGEADICADVREEARIEGGVGTICMTLAGKPDDFNYDVECGVGDIRIDNERYSGFGRDARIDNAAEKDVRVECGTGSVELMFAEEHHEEEGVQPVDGHHEEEHD